MTLTLTLTIKYVFSVVFSVDYESEKKTAPFHLTFKSYPPPLKSDNGYKDTYKPGKQENTGFDSIQFNSIQNILYCQRYNSC